MTREDGIVICDHCGKELIPGVDAIYTAELPQYLSLKIGGPTRDYCSLEYLIFFQTFGTAEIIHSILFDELVACWHIRHEKDERDSIIELPYALSFGQEATNKMAITKFGEVKFVLKDGEIPVRRTRVETKRPEGLDIPEMRGSPSRN